MRGALGYLDHLLRQRLVRHDQGEDEGRAVNGAVQTHIARLTRAAALIP
jgi:hypothetical protein